MEEEEERMSQNAVKLAADIAAAEKRVAELEVQCRKLSPPHREQVEHQIKLARDAIRNMRIEHAGMQDHSDIPCRHCGTLITHSFIFCRTCMRELTLKLYASLKNAVGLLHHKKVQPSHLEDCIKACIGHLKQHSSAV